VLGCLSITKTKLPLEQLTGFRSASGQSKILYVIPRQSAEWLGKEVQFKEDVCLEFILVFHP